MKPIVTHPDEPEMSVFVSDHYKPNTSPRTHPSSEKPSSARRRRTPSKKIKCVNKSVAVAGDDGEESSSPATMGKRRLTDEQAKFLEMNFGEERKLESLRKIQLAIQVGLEPKQVAIWFQNRRARWKNKQMEGEYVKLKAMHDAVLMEKCQLETQVLKLKERLSESEEEIRKLIGGGGSSPSSSFSTATPHPPPPPPPLDGELVADLMYTDEYGYNHYWTHGLDELALWDHLRC